MLVTGGSVEVARASIGKLRNERKLAAIGVVATIKVVDGGEAVSERKRAFGGGQNSTLKKAGSEQRRGKSAS